MFPTRFAVRCCAAVLVLGLSACTNFGKDLAATPPERNDLVGSYVTYPQSSYAVSLILEENGEFTANWQGCKGEYAYASGAWTFEGRSVKLVTRVDHERFFTQRRELLAIVVPHGRTYALATPEDVRSGLIGEQTVFERYYE